MDCDVYRPHAELGKYPLRYRLKKGEEQEKRQCYSELESLIHIFNNLLTKHTQTCAEAGASVSSTSGQCKVTHCTASYTVKLMLRGTFEIPGEVFQA